MKRMTILSVACVTILLAIGVTSFLTSSYAQAGRGIQMVSGTFTDQNLPTDGSKVTLISIPFNVSATTGKLEATSLIDATNIGAFANSVICEVDVDGVSFFSVTTSVAGVWQSDVEDSASIDLTSTTNGIVTGNHILTVKCLSSQNAGTLTLHSLGTSVIIIG